MLLQRILVVAILLPIGLTAIIVGGWLYLGVVLIFLGMAAWEYVHLFRTGGYQPAGLFVVVGVVALIVGRAVSGFDSTPWLFSLLVLLAMAHHLLAYERGRDQSAADFGVTVAGFTYIGWIGAYFISLRNVSDGLWWVLLVLCSVWSADSMAYSIGRKWGRRKLSPRLSPKKTWEGYFASVISGTLAGALLGFLFERLIPNGSAFTLWRGVITGFIMGVVPTLGDLGESMVKRQVGAKDSGNALPGHGGFFDRIDSWLWAAVIGYYLVTWFFI
jgi:phosphatidate cytidylyltransferase